METTYPLAIKYKGHEVVIYSTPINGSPAYTLVWYEGGRKRAVRSNEAEAHAEATRVAKRLAGAEMKLEPGAAAVYRSALKSIVDIKTADGESIKLDEVCRQFAQGWKLAPNKIIEACAYYSERSASAVKEGVLLATAIDEFLTAKAVDVSADYMREYRSKLGQLKESFVLMPIAKITAPMIDDWLRGLTGISRRTRHNARTTVRTFFRWAQSRKYVPSDFGFDEGVADVGGLKRRPVQLLSPEELAKLLAHAPSHLVPFLCLQAFAGLRHAEVCRLEWRDINWGRDGEIEIRDEIAKGREGEEVRRTVPILPCLRKWLRPYVKTSGLVMPEGKTDMTKELHAVAKSAGMVWKRNALRKSFISYRVKLLKSLDQVALEAGNSPAIIKKHYLRVAKTKAAAKAWFSIEPQAASNVVELRKAV